MSGRTLKPLERLALEVSTFSAPERKPGNLFAYVPWDVVLEIRRQLEAEGIDWRTPMKTYRAGRGYRS